MCNPHSYSSNRDTNDPLTWWYSLDDRSNKYSRCYHAFLYSFIGRRPYYFLHVNYKRQVKKHFMHEYFMLLLLILKSSWPFLYCCFIKVSRRSNFFIVFSINNLSSLIVNRRGRVNNLFLLQYVIANLASKTNN